MPATSCSKGGKPGWKWGGSGKCYTYKKGDAAGSARAKAKANAQGAAIHAARGKSATIDRVKSFFVKRAVEVVEEESKK